MSEQVVVASGLACESKPGSEQCCTSPFSPQRGYKCEACNVMWAGYRRCWNCNSCRDTLMVNAYPMILLPNTIYRDLRDGASPDYSGE